MLFRAMSLCCSLGTISVLPTSSAKSSASSMAEVAATVLQYGKWIGRVLQGDLGTSVRTRRPLTYELRLRLPVTIELTCWPGCSEPSRRLVGVVAAVRRNSRLDYAATVTTLIGISVRIFCSQPCWSCSSL